MKYILHVDGDAFFASCEIARRPDLKGKPAVVGEERGIACALTYEAKKLGVYRGMPIFQIREKYPEVTVLSSHFELYEHYNRNLCTILEKYLPLVERYSIDECFGILPALSKKEIEPFVRSIKNEVQQSLGITCSFGVATTKTLAKIASKKEKPDGCVFLIDEKKISDALKNAPVGSIWGVGRATNAQLVAKSILKASEFIALPISTIKEWFGEPLAETWNELKGKRIYEVHTSRDDQKSIQATRSFQATSNASMLFSEFSRNVETACEHLRNMKMFTNSIHFFYRNASEGRHRQWTETLLPVYTDDPKIILQASKPLISRIFIPGQRYKSTGITLLNLKRYEYIQDDLFGVQNKHKEMRSHLKALDAINQKFGPWSIMHASSLKSVQRRQKEFEERARKDTYKYGLPLPYMGEVY